MIRENRWMALFCLLGLCLLASCKTQVMPQSQRGIAAKAKQGALPQACALEAPEPALPLHTKGNQIVDANGNPVRLAAVNWYGAEGPDFVVGGLQLEPLNEIARRIRCLGFNAVRLPWSNEMYESNPVVSSYALTANPKLIGSHALQIYTQVVSTLAAQGLMVILDNHTSNAEWCCSASDGNELWYNSQYPQSSWVADWEGMVKRFENVPQVVGVDLRNEPRYPATWGGSPSTDWHAAAELGGDAVLSVNPKLLIMVEGINYSLDLTGVKNLPVKLSVPHRVVYAPHNYSFDQSDSSATQLDSDWDQAWGYILTPGQTYTAPIWLGEFGNCNNDQSCINDTASGSSGLWFSALRQYIQKTGISWSWWAINGTETTGSGRTFGSAESYGILNPYWNAPSIPNSLGQTENVADALNTIAQPSPIAWPTTPELAPIVSIVRPVPGDTIASGSNLTILVNASLASGSSDSISSVQLYVNGQPAVSSNSTSSPYTLTWANVPSGSYDIQALATTKNGLQALSQKIPIQAINYHASRSSDVDGIGVNFLHWDGTPMASTQFAGVSEQKNWNQAGVTDDGTLHHLVDANGVATAASVTWTSPNTYFDGATTGQSGDDLMMIGYLDSNGFTPNTVSVSGIPWGTYDVIIYYNGDIGTAARLANYRVTTTDSSGQVQGCNGEGPEGSTVSGADATNFNGTFVRASNDSVGNYVEFFNCTGPELQIAPVHGQSTDGQVRASINGLQILTRQ